MRTCGDCSHYKKTGHLFGECRVPTPQWAKVPKEGGTLIMPENRADKCAAFIPQENLGTGVPAEGK